MLHELRVENLLLIERAELRLAPGLNVLTGETGAGKTVLAHALDLLLGGRARAGIVRPGRRRGLRRGRLRPARRAARRARELIAPGRRGARAGPARERRGAHARLRSTDARAAVADLRDVAAGLIVFYGQHEHRKLTLGLGAARAARRRLRAGAGRAARRASPSCTRACATLEGVAGRAARARRRPGPRARPARVRARRDRGRPTPPRRRRPSSRRGASGCATSRRCGRPRSAAPRRSRPTRRGVAGAAGRGRRGARRRRGRRPGARRRSRSAGARWPSRREDLAAELRGYGEGLEAEPGELDVVEERLAVLDRLKRKHGGTIALVLEHADGLPRAARRARPAPRSRSSARPAELAAARAELGRRAARAARPRAWRPRQALAAAVRERLARAGDGGRRRSTIAVEPREEPAATGRRRRSSSSSPPTRACPPAPLRDIASGGELSRVMLALMGVANDGSQATLVFDEVDAGHRRRHGARGRRAAARPGRGPAGRLHHPPAADRLAGGPPLLDRQGRRPRARPHHGAARWRARRSSPSSCGCSARGTTTWRPAATPRSC